MRRILIAVASIVIVLIVIIIAIPFLIPTSVIKNQAESRLSEILGRDFKIAGDLQLRRWPPLSLQATDVELANADWAEPATMVSIAALDFDADLLALIGGRVVLDKLVLTDPIINLATDADGQGNWQMGGDDRAADAGDSVDEDSGAGVDIPEFEIGEIAINNGTLSFRDGATGETRTFEQISLAIGGEEGSRALDINASVLSAGETATIAGRIDDAAALASGSQSALTLKAEVPGGSLAIDGSVDTGGSGFTLNTTLDMDDVRHLADWAGAPLELPEGTLKTIDLKAVIDGNPKSITIQDLQLAVDELAIGANLELVEQGRWKISGTVDLGDLDLNPYLPPSEQSKSGDTAESTGAASEGWPDDPLDLPLPLPVDLDLAIALASLKAAPLELGAGNIQVLADPDITQAEIETLALYQGDLVGKASLAGSPAHDLDLALQATGIDALELLRGLAQVETLDGTANFKTELKSSGNSVKDIVGSLNGTGSLYFRDGAIIGINIGATLRKLMTLNLTNEAEEKRTDFAELGGTYTITDGILDNKDLALRAPILRVTGAGKVDLPAQTLDYRVVPQLAASTEGQDAEQEPTFAAGLPVVISGSWADPSFQVEIGDVLSGNLFDPQGMTGALEEIAKNPEVLEELSGVFGRSAGEVGKFIENIVPGADGKQGQGSGSGGDVDKLIEGFGSILNNKN